MNITDFKFIIMPDNDIQDTNSGIKIKNAIIIFFFYNTKNVV